MLMGIISDSTTKMIPSLLYNFIPIEIVVCIALRDKIIFFNVTLKPKLILNKSNKNWKRKENFEVLEDN